MTSTHAKMKFTRQTANKHKDRWMNVINPTANAVHNKTVGDY